MKGRYSIMDGENITCQSKVIADAKKVRRRVEDVLRKSNVKTIYEVAKLLGVSTEIKPAKEEIHGN